MALFFLLTAPLCVAVFVDDKYEDPPACQLLQTGLSLKASRKQRSDWQAESNASVMNGVCFPNLTQDLVTPPIREVIAKYDEDGYCVFGKHGLWSSGCAVTRREHSAFHYVNQFKDYYPAVLNVSWATPFTLHLYDNRSLTIRMRAYPLVDLYCFVNGWYNLPNRAEVVNNFTYLEELSDKWCEHLSRTVPGYYNISFQNLVDESDRDEDFLENLMNGSGAGYVPKSVVDGMYVHAAAKCVMRGGQRGAICDIADCAAQGCFAPHSSELHYTVRGECQNVLK